MRPSSGCWEAAISPGGSSIWAGSPRRGALLWAYARPLGTGPAAAGALLFALYHLSGGAWRVGQRDFLLCLFLLAGAYGVARSIERGGALGPLVWGGLALGIGMTVKPHAGAFWLRRGGARRVGRVARQPRAARRHPAPCSPRHSSRPR